MDLRQSPTLGAPSKVLPQLIQRELIVELAGRVLVVEHPLAPKGLLAIMDLRPPNPHHPLGKVIILLPFSVSIASGHLRGQRPLVIDGLPRWLGRNDKIPMKASKILVNRPVDSFHEHCLGSPQRRIG